MDRDIKLLTDRINDLENQIIQLNQEISYKETKIDVKNKTYTATSLFFVPVIALTLLFMGTNYN